MAEPSLPINPQDAAMLRAALASAAAKEQGAKDGSSGPGHPSQAETAAALEEAQREAQRGEEDAPLPPVADHACLQVSLSPPTIAVGQVTAAVVGLAAGVDSITPVGAELPTISRIDWEVLLPGHHRWVPLMPYAKPFPWDPQTIVPNADMVGLNVRGVAVLADPQGDRPVLEFATERETGRKMARQRRFVTPAVIVQLPDGLAAPARKAAAMEKFGFHCAIGSRANTRLLGLVSRDAPGAAVMKVEAVEVPDQDGIPMRTVWAGEVQLTGPNVADTVCELHQEDQVTLQLHASWVTQCDRAPTDARVKRPGPAPSSAKAAAAADDVEAKGDEAELTGLEIVVRTAKDRDMIALCLRSVHAQWQKEAARST